MRKPVKRALAIVGVAVVAALTGLGVTGALAQPTPTHTPDHRVDGNGQRVGVPRAGATVQPDLIPTRTDDGKSGYIYRSDVAWPAARNPEEAVRIMKERVNPDGTIIVPVYAEDGKTRIGYFTAGEVEVG